MKLLPGFPEAQNGFKASNINKSPTSLDKARIIVKMHATDRQSFNASSSKTELLEQPCIGTKFMVLNKQ
jgi:hypothetical protein